MFFCPSLPICGAEVLDLFVLAEALSHAVIGVQVIADSGTRPHLGVRLVMQAGARRRTVMKLKAAKALRCPIWAPLSG